MQHPYNFPASSSEMELYRCLPAPCGTTGALNDVVGLPPPSNYYYGNFGGSNNNSSSCSSSFYPAMSGLFTETTAYNKAIEASRLHHKEAEKRRRERINSHLDRLRSLLPCPSKTDKATLLSKVVQRVLELKRQTSELLKLDNLIIPSENDEFSVYIIHNDDGQTTNNDHNNDNNNNNNDRNSNKLVLKASLCCEDRPDLLTDLNDVLSSLRLKTLRSEISTLGGRIHGVLVVCSEDNKCHRDECAVFLRDALKGVVQRSSSSDRLKRRCRVFNSTC